MKNYSSRRAQRGRLAYRTPSRFRFQKDQEIKKQKSAEIFRKRIRP